ncbi:unnamed protein product [Pleuronectes platessa]|uniref:Uncharacterized protein n=1 Tax=Pleuronectes platessa TaxID=8262 RepID=A0A9N7UUP5_PLEPL|nr:unnamed protein product [Pleuronectes platessa]
MCWSVLPTLCGSAPAPELDSGVRDALTEPVFDKSAARGLWPRSPAPVLRGSRSFRDRMERRLLYSVCQGEREGGREGGREEGMES